MSAIHCREENHNELKWLNIWVIVWLTYSIFLMNQVLACTPKDLDNIIKIIQKIRDKGNSVLLVEHDPDLIRTADHVVDMGPLSGINGGEIIYQGTFEELKIHQV